MKNKMPTINCSRFILREIKKEDYLDYFFIGSDFETTKYLTWGPFEEPSQALFALEKFYLNRNLFNLPNAYAIVLKRTDEVIGLIEFHTYFPHENSAEIGFLLRSDYQGKGIMTEALNQMIKLGFEYLELDKIIVGHVDVNLACKNLVKKCGFKYEYVKYCAFSDKETALPRDIVYYSIYKNEVLL